MKKLCFLISALLFVFLFSALTQTVRAQGSCSCSEDPLETEWLCLNTCDAGYTASCTFDEFYGDCISCTCITSALPNPSYTVQISCQANQNEPHPLRPYPGEICEPPEISDYNLPFCAMRPWAVQQIEYLRNIQDCAPGDEIYPCVNRFVEGDYSIDLSAYELPLVSVNRSEYNTLSFFERSQQHTADYLEGRAFYEGIVEPVLPDYEPDVLSSVFIWSRLGVFRKLTPYALQNQLKVQNIRNAAGSDPAIHNYIVGYYSDSEDRVAAWRQGNPVRISEFNRLDRQPPEYNCDTIPYSPARESCLRQYWQNFENWHNSRWGKLWPYIPMFTREDTLGYVTLYPDPSVLAPETAVSNQVSIPHLPRLLQVSTKLQQALSLFGQTPDYEEMAPDEGVSCPAGPWTACPAYVVGCTDSDLTCTNPDEVDCDQSSTATSACVKPEAEIANLASLWVEGREGNQVDLCYNDVIGRSQEAGVDPCLAMLIWLNESNASNYNLSRQDFGINDSQYECSFRAQINQFLNRPSNYRTGWPHCFGAGAPINPGTGSPMTPMEAFLWIFRTGDCVSGNLAGQLYAAGIIERYNLVCNCDMPEYPI